MFLCLRATGVAIVGWLVCSAAPMAAAELTFERVFGPEHPGGPYKHPASIEQLANGDLYLVFYGGAGEYDNDTAVWGARRRRGAADWSTPRVIADTPGQSDGNAVIWQAPDGVAWLFYLTRYGATWSTSRIKAKISTDAGETWSDSLMLSFEQGTMVRSRPIVLADGDYLLPVYHETGNDTEASGSDTTSFFLRYDLATRTWSETNRIGARMGCLQPAVARITDDYLVCYNRRGGDYQPTTRGYIVRSESRDGGQTWSPGVETAWPNPNSAVDFLRLKNGHLLLIYNDSFSDRTPLTATISVDGDKSYPYRRNLAEGPASYAYPFAIQTQDGLIHVVYTTEERTTIMHVSFDEQAILPDLPDLQGESSR